MLTDTKTRPEPSKTVEDLWFELRVASLYGNLWERQENEIALHWGRAGVSVPEDVSSLLGELKASAPRRRPGINDFYPDPGFRTDELGYGSGENYWRTQHTFPAQNVKRDKQYQQEIDKLKKARQVLARSVRT
jgi:hypothetical protein